MTLDPRPTLSLPARPLAAIAAVLFLATGLVACTPAPEEVDESPVAGMTEENPSDDQILGEAITPREAGDATLTLSGTPTVEGAAEVTCAVEEAPEHHGADGHGAGDHGAESGGDDDHATGAGDHQSEEAATHGDAGDAGAEAHANDDDAGHEAELADHDEHGSADGEHGGDDAGDHGVDHGGGHLVLAKTATFSLTPPGDAPLRLVVEIPNYEGEGEYEATFRLEGIAEDGSYAESTGTGTAVVEAGTRLASDAGTHWIGGTFEGTYTGDAGDGEASGSVERCYYFK